MVGIHCLIHLRTLSMHGPKNNGIKQLRQDNKVVHWYESACTDPKYQNVWRQILLKWHHPTAPHTAHLKLGFGRAELLKTPMVLSGILVTKNDYI